VAEDVGWFYPEPVPAVQSIRDHVAFYAGPMDCCLVGGEQARGAGLLTCQDQR